MNTMNLYPLRVWRRLKHSFTAWHARAGLRIELKDLTDSTLQDIGLWRGNERSDPGKLFWIP
jgi:uncharacterized protein YjiS (DUF1127 family)